MPPCPPPSPRRRDEGRALLRAFRAGKDRLGFRLVHFSIQGNHLHLLVETRGREAPGRGMKGLPVRGWRRLGLPSVSERPAME